MTKAIFYTTRAIDGREGKNLCRHLTILKHTHTAVDMLTANSESGTKKAQEYGHLDIAKYHNHYGGFYANEAKEMDDWMAVYNAINPIALKEYSALYLIGGLDLHRSNLGRFENRVGVFPHDRGQLKFESCGLHLVNILAMVKAHNEYGIPLHEIAFDPNEMSCNLFHVSVAPVREQGYYLYHGYDIPLYGAHRLDSLQCWLEAEHGQPKNSVFDFNDTSKKYDFTFGYTVLKESGREHYPNDITLIATQFKNPNLFVKDEYRNINTHVAADKYLDLIKESRFTYMLPSYNKHCFSVYRFLESIYHDCLPLIHPDCNINDIGESFSILADLKILQNGNVPSESERLDILERLKTAMLTPASYFKK
jgi:hypothetical protein